MNKIWHISKGIILAQLGVPIYILLFIINSGEFDAAKLVMFSIFGFLLSAPCSLIIGVPVSILLYRTNKLKPIYIMTLSPLTIIPLVLYSGSIDIILYLGPAVLIGAILFSVYVAKSTVLTSQTTQT